MGKKIYKVGIVGYGHMAAAHHHDKMFIERGEELGIELKGVFDTDSERMELAKSKGLVTYESREALLADEEIDIVLCATTNEFHRDIGVDAMKAGKHFVTEKPVTMNSAELQDLIDTSNETGKIFTVHQNRRWDEDFLTIKEVYDKELLGEVFEIQTRVLGSRGIPNDWRGIPKHGGGMILDWGVHIIDQILMMVDGEIESVYCTLQNVTTEIVDDGFRIILKFKSGLLVVLEVMTSAFIAIPRWNMLGIDGTAIIQRWGSDCEITRIFDKTKNDAVPIQTAAGLTKTMAPRTEDTIKTESMPLVKADVADFYANVIAAIEGREEQLVKHHEVMRVFKVMEAAFESAKTGQVVSFE